MAARTIGQRARRGPRGPAPARPARGARAERRVRSRAAILTTSARPATQLAARRASSRCAEVGHDRARLVEGADEVLARRVVEARSCRPPRRRPSRAAWSAPARSARRAAGTPPRTRPGRRRRRRRPRRRARRDRRPRPSAASQMVDDARERLVPLAGGQRHPRALDRQRARAPPRWPSPRARCTFESVTSTTDDGAQPRDGVGQPGGRVVADVDGVAARAERHERADRARPARAIASTIASGSSASLDSDRWHSA